MLFYRLPFFHLPRSGLMHIIECHCSVILCKFSTVIGANLTFSEREKSQFSFFLSIIFYPSNFYSGSTISKDRNGGQTFCWQVQLLLSIMMLDTRQESLFSNCEHSLLLRYTSFSSCTVSFPCLRQLCLNVYILKIYIMWLWINLQFSYICYRNSKYIYIYMCYCKSSKVGESQVLPVYPSMCHCEMVKVRKRLVNASISGFYQTISVNAGICQHLLVKVRNELIQGLRMSGILKQTSNYFCLFKDYVNGIGNEKSFVL